MLKKIMPIFATLSLLAGPLSAFALEQSFAQNGLKAEIKLTPDELVVGKKVDLALKLEKDGQTAMDRLVTLEVYGKDSTEPTIKREVDFLGDEYLDSWSFEKPGDYKVVVTIAVPGNPAATLHYEVRASVGEAKDPGHDGHEEHGFFSHHFGGGKWGWWGAGLMLLIMVPLMIVGL